MAPMRTRSIAAAGDDPELARRASAGDQQAFDLLFDRYFARTSWYFFTIFARRKATVAVAEVLTALFGSLNEDSGMPLAERAYRLSVAAEVRHASEPVRAKPAKVQRANPISQFPSAPR